MALTIIVTNAGRAALVNAQHDGTSPVTIANVGVSPTAIAAAPAMTVLPDETKRIAAKGGDVVADDTIHLIVQDESNQVYSVRSFALYLADGTLFALYGQADIIVEKSAQSLLNLAIDVTFADVDANQLTFGDTNFLNPPATTTRRGVVELATEAEGEAGTDTERAVTPKGVKTAVTSWINARFGEGAPTAFAKTLLTVASAAALRVSLGLKGAALKDDGAGSTLDADLLDGQQGAFYADIPSRLGFTPVRQGGGAGQLDNTVRIGWTGLRLKGAVDATDLGNFVFDGNIVDVWRASNDGSGSGMDADLLDGYHAGAFALLTGAAFTGDISTTGIATTAAVRALGASSGVEISDRSQPAVTGRNWVLYSVSNSVRFSTNGADRVTFTDTGIVIASGYSRSGFSVWDAGNDGAGSGLDADLLDGMQPAFSDYAGTSVAARQNGRLGAYGFHVDGAFTDLIDGAPSYGLGKTVLNGVLGGKVIQLGGFFGVRIATQYQTLDIPGAGPMAYNGTPVWTAGNDGSGSGLDADLLDGFQAADFIRHAQLGSNLADNGFIGLPNGFILQWGKYRSAGLGEMAVPITFPIAFPHALFSAQATAYIAVGRNTGNQWAQRVGEGSTTGASFYTQSHTDGSTIDGFDWWAIGW